MCHVDQPLGKLVRAIKPLKYHFSIPTVLARWLQEFPLEVGLLAIFTPRSTPGTLGQIGIKFILLAGITTTLCHYQVGPVKTGATFGLSAYGASPTVHTLDPTLDSTLGTIGVIHRGSVALFTLMYLVCASLKIEIYLL